jgi:hypothetical protein
MEHDAVILEVGLNEAVSRDAHPHVPQSPAECAADARRCADAGAAIAHWHAVDSTGVQQLGDAGLYGAALDEMNGCILAYPSYLTTVPDTVEDRLAHCLALREHHALELGPVDVATVNLVFWDAATGVLAPLGSGELPARHDPLDWLLRTSCQDHACSTIRPLASAQATMMRSGNETARG